MDVTSEEHYIFCTKNRSYRDRFLSEVRDLELVKMHLEFESLGGIFNCPTRFADIVERAGWESGIKMIKAINSVITMLQSTGKLGREDIMTRMSDRLQSDDGDILYRFYPGNDGYQLITYHLFEENTTKVRIFKGDTEEYSAEVFEW